MAATVVIVDGVGGGIGAQLVDRLKRELADQVSIIALGANAVATQRMVDAGAERGASGENAVCVTAPTADFILGPIGIVLPNAMMGEITSRMAEAVLAARGRKLLLPLSQPHVTIVGISPKNVSDLIGEAIHLLRQALVRPG